MKDKKTENIIEGAINIKLPFAAHRAAKTRCIERNSIETEELLKRALIDSNTVVLAQDKSLKYTWICNPRSNFLNEKIIGKKDSDLMSVEDAAALERIKKSVLKTGKEREDEVKISFNNQVFFYDLRTEPIVDEKEDIIGISCRLTDITRLKNIESYLKQEQNITKKILETTPDTIYIIDLSKNRNIFINKDLPLGYSSEDIEKWKKPAKFLKLVHPDDKSRVMGHFLELLSTKNYDVQEIEFRIKDKKENWHWVNTRNTVFLRSSDDQVKQIMGTAKDVTQRKNWEEALRRSEERYSLAQKAANIGSWDWDIKTGSLRWSERIEPIFGLKAGKFDGKFKTFLKFIHPKDRENIVEAIDSSLNGEKIYDIDHRVVWQDHSIHWVRETGDVIRDRDGKPIRMIGIVQDITEKKEMENYIKERDDWLQAIIDNSGSIIYAKDIKGRYILFNNRCEDMTGFRRKDVLGKTDRELFPKKYADLYVANDRRVIRTKETIQVEEEGLMRNKPIFSLAVKFPIFDLNGNVKAVCGINTDITEMKELEYRKDNFISMASHELKTPITSIKVFTQILQKMPQYQIAGKYLSRMDEQINRLTVLVNDLLDVSKIQTGKLQLLRSTFSLSEIVNESVEISQATTRKHKFIIKKNPEIKIYADKYRIGQVFSNLLSNAIKYSPKGGNVIVNVLPNGKNATISIQDFGVGVSKRYQDKIFNRFFRVYKEKDKTYPGLGMGLYISYDIVKRHEGDMWIKSEKGKGSTFYFTVPLGR